MEQDPLFSPDALPVFEVPKKKKKRKKTEKKGDDPQADILDSGINAQPADIMRKKDLLGMCLAQGSKGLHSIIESQVNPVIHLFRQESLPDWVKQILAGQPLSVDAHEVYPVHHKDGTVDLAVRKH